MNNFRLKIPYCNCCFPLTFSVCITKLTWQELRSCLLWFFIWNVKIRQFQWCEPVIIHRKYWKFLKYVISVVLRWITSTVQKSQTIFSLLISITSQLITSPFLLLYCPTYFPHLPTVHSFITFSSFGLSHAFSFHHIYLSSFLCPEDSPNTFFPPSPLQLCFPSPPVAQSLFQLLLELCAMILILIVKTTRHDRLTINKTNKKTFFLLQLPPFNSWSCLHSLLLLDFQNHPTDDAAYCSYTLPWHHLAVFHLFQIAPCAWDCLCAPSSTVIWDPISLPLLEVWVQQPFPAFFCPSAFIRLTPNLPNTSPSASLKSSSITTLSHQEYFLPLHPTYSRIPLSLLTACWACALMRLNMTPSMSSFKLKILSHTFFTFKTLFPYSFFKITPTWFGLVEQFWIYSNSNAPEAVVVVGPQPVQNRNIILDESHVWFGKDFMLDALPETSLSIYPGLGLTLGWKQ